MLLDEKRTKRIARIGAILTVLAFVGGGAVLALVSIFGGSSSSTSALISDAQQEIKQSPNSVTSWDDLASAYQTANDSSKAISAAQHAQKLDPADQSSAFALVTLYTNADNYSAAIAVLQRYTAHNPTDPDGFLTLGELADQIGNATLASTAYEKYLALAPAGTTATEVRDHLPALAKIRAAQRLTTAKPKDPAAWNALTSAFIAEQNATGALTAATEATSLAPANVGYAQRLSSVYADAGESTAAVEVMQQFTKQNPKNAEGFYWLGYYAQQAKQTSTARTAYQTSLTLAPSGPKAAAAKSGLAALGSG